jgi:Flp pilus assembly CpaF family ATPase
MLVQQVISGCLLWYPCGGVHCGDEQCAYRAIKSNIADSLNLIVHIERRPGRRFVSEILEVQKYNPEGDVYDLAPVFVRKEEV